MTENPLKKYSQRPGTFVTLPSRGKYYPYDVELTVDGDIEIKPMTASDELKLKNPDGLMNSESLFQVIENVVPSIKRARDIPTPDLDAIVIGLRLATYGDQMDVSITCASCNDVETYQINISSMLASMKAIDAPDQVVVGDLKVNIRPHTAETTTLVANYNVELARAALMVEQAVTRDQDLEKNLAKIIEKGQHMLYDAAIKHVVSVETPDGDIIDSPEFILEWIKDLSAPDYRIIKDAVDNLSEERIDRNRTFKCVKCGHENKIAISFDPSTFFDTSSR